MDKNNVIGFIAYAYNDDAVIIYDFDDGGDLYLCDGLVRSVLFKGCLTVQFLKLRIKLNLPD